MSQRKDLSFLDLNHEGTEYTKIAQRIILSESLCALSGFVVNKNFALLCVFAFKQKRKQL